MASHSDIEWTDATWNPVTGCTKVSPGCKHCYAETFAERFRGVPGHPFEQGFDLKLWPNRLSLPQTWRKPRMVFVNSMSDLFHEDVPDAFIDQVFETMRECDWHVFQVLTKRAERMREYTSSRYDCVRGSRSAGKRPWPRNVWLGVSVETNRYRPRIAELQKSPAFVRFLSLEPLLGPLELSDGLLSGISWVIVGGESGHRARPMDPQWVTDIHRRCQETAISFFFKQWGAHDATGKRVGKKAAGRILYGKVWNEMPV